MSQRTVRSSVLVLALAFAGVATADPRSAEIVLQRMKARQAALTSLQARIEQVKTYPQLGIEAPPERGRLSLRRRRTGTSVRMEIEEPERRILVVKEGRYLLYQPRIRQVMEGAVQDSSAKSLFSGVLTGSPEAMTELERSYSIGSDEPSELSGRKVHRLRFDARPGAAVYCQRIEIFVDDRTFLPLGQSCREANDSVVTFSLSDVETDIELDDDLFEVAIPEGVERLKG
jgi:outer membrane lipoprotein-sorting protein